jgi:hypothetical protein
LVVDICGAGDFTSLRPAINALPANGGKIFVKAGVYPITSTINNYDEQCSDSGRRNGHNQFRLRQFAGCMAIGGIPATLTVGGVVPKPEVYGFQSEASIVGNMIANVQAIERTAGTGIYLDGPDTSGEPGTATSNHTITGNVRQNIFYH